MADLILPRHHHSITTGNFQTAGTLADAIAISRGVPIAYTGLRYLALAPSRSMLKIRDHSEFAAIYLRDVLADLDPQKVLADLYELAAEPILLCWEPPHVFCHRRAVAEFLEGSLGITVSEYGFDRSSSLPLSQLPPAPKSNRGRKPGKAQGQLFSAS